VPFLFGLPREETSRRGGAADGSGRKIS
jgi:hypothetical protein